MLAGALSSISVACSAQPDTRLDRTFDPCAGVAIAVEGHDANQLSAVDAAVALWNGSGPLRLTRDETLGLPRLAVSFEKAALAFRGVYDDESGTVIVNSALTGERTRTIIVAHELGHAFGLLHTGEHDGASVMKADNTNVAPTPSDMAKLQSVWESCSTSP